MLETLKLQKKQNMGKKLNLLDEKDNGLQLFSLLKIWTTFKYMQSKEVEKKQHKKDIEGKNRK